MTVYSVQRVLQRTGGSAVPSDAHVYIRQANASGGIFRTDAAGGSVFRLAGAAWTAVSGGLSVDTGQPYLAFWMPRAASASLPTTVLQHALNVVPRNPYQFTPSGEDAGSRRIRVNQYQTVTVQAVPVEGPFWYKPGCEVTPQGGPAHGPTNFWLKTSWQTSATTGFLVQEISTRMDATTCGGAALNISPDIYWEAWQITGANQFDPNGFDYWTIETGINTRGTWTKTGRVYWVPALLDAWHFTTSGAPHAGQLLSTTHPPRNLGTPILTRHAGGRWNGCAAHVLMNTHDPN